MNIIDKLIQWLTAHIEIEIAILFGSYAKGPENIYSDIDLAIQLTLRNTLE